LDGIRYQTVHLRFVRDISGNDKRLAAFSFDLSGRSLAEVSSSGGDDDPGAFPPKEQGNGFSNSATASRDNRHFIG
jgi:hypothetical protein